MNRFIGSTLAGALVLAFGFGTIGCQEGATSSGSKDEGIKKAKEAGQRMGDMQKKMQEKMGAAPPPAGGADEDKEKAKEDKKDDKGKDKNKGGDKE